jgi:hypothetical protein
MMSREKHKAKPWFLYLAFNAVHTPMHATDDRLAKFPGIADKQRRTYAVDPDRRRQRGDRQQVGPLRSHVFEQFIAGVSLAIYSPAKSAKPAAISASDGRTT